MSVAWLIGRLVSSRRTERMIRTITACIFPRLYIYAVSDRQVSTSQLRARCRRGGSCGLRSRILCAIGLRGKCTVDMLASRRLQKIRSDSLTITRMKEKTTFSSRHRSFSTFLSGSTTKRESSWVTNAVTPGKVTVQNGRSDPDRPRLGDISPYPSRRHRQLFLSCPGPFCRSSHRCTNVPPAHHHTRPKTAESRSATTSCHPSRPAGEHQPPLLSPWRSAGTNVMMRANEVAGNAPTPCSLIDPISSPRQRDKLSN